MKNRRNDGKGILEEQNGTGKRRGVGGIFVSF